MSPEEIDGEKIEKIRVLWDEYKYRHEHCWKIFFQTTAAFVVLSVVPYVQMEVVRGLGWRVITMPLLGLLIVVFALAVVTNELGLLDKVKAEYRILQKDIFKITHEKDGITFKKLVGVYFAGLIVIGVINVYSISQSWIPYVERVETNAGKVKTGERASENK